MSDDLIPAEARAMVGQSLSDDVEGEVTAKEAQRFAQAVDDLNPLYFDDAYARAAGYERAVAPPLFFNVAITASLPLAQTREDGIFRSRQRGIPLKVKRTMFGGEDVEFHAPVYPGDRLTAETTLESVEQKEGGSGPFVLSVRKLTIRNQDGAIVAISRSTGITR